MVLFSCALVAQGLWIFRNPDCCNLAFLLAAQVTLVGPLLFFGANTLAQKWASLYLTQMTLAFGTTAFFVEDWTLWGLDVLASDCVLTDSLAVTAVGVGAGTLGILWPPRRRTGHNARAAISFRPLWGSWWGWHLSYWGTIWLFHFWDPGRLGFIGVVVLHWPIASCLALDILARSGRAPPHVLPLVWGVLVPLRMLLNLGTSFLAFIFNEGVIIIFYLTMRRVLTLRFSGILLACALMVFLYSARTHIRLVMWESSDAPETRLGVAAAALRVAWNESSVDGYQSALEDMIVRRIGHYNLGAHTVVVHDTPDLIPFLNGESYVHLLWAVVPRVVYPEKPIAAWGQRFGHRYEFLAPNDDWTSFNLPQLTESYANGGIWLTAIVMWLLGWTVHRIGRWAESLDPASCDALWLVLPIVLSQMNECFSNLALSVNGALYNALVFGAPALLSRSTEGSGEWQAAQHKGSGSVQSRRDSIADAQ